MSAVFTPATSRSFAEPVIQDLGRMEYGRALELQRDIQRRVIESRESGAHKMTVLFVEHDPPVITISRRPGASAHLIASESQLRAAGVRVAQTDRGGDITYHGPGQLVVYPILDLNALNLRLNGYLRLLEQIIIDTLAHFSIHGHRDPTATGVWVSQSSSEFRVPSSQFQFADQLGTRNAELGASTPTSKIAAIGVRVSRWVTMHGFALNVTTNLDHFNLIVPCGLKGRSITSMRQILGDRCPDMTRIKQALAQTVHLALGRDQIDVPSRLYAGA